MCLLDRKLCYFFLSLFLLVPCAEFFAFSASPEVPCASSASTDVRVQLACSSDFSLELFSLLCSPCSERPRLIKGRLSFLLKWLRPKIEHILFKSKSDYVFPSIKNPCQYAWTKLIQKDTFTPMFIAALFTIAKTRRQPNVHQQTNG